MYAKIFATLAPILICTGVGYMWARLKRPFDTEFVSSLVFNIGAPCLVVTSLYSVELQPDLLARVAGACFLICLAVGLAGAALLRVFALDARTYLSSLMFGNVGNMGLPLCLFAFGEQGLAMGIAYFVAHSILHFTIGISIVQGISCRQMASLLKNPILVSIVVAVGLILSDIQLPLWLFQPLKLLAEVTIPLMLLTLGVSLNRLRVGNLPKSIGLGGLRIGLGFGFGLAAVHLLPLEGVARGVVLIQASMPVAVFNYLFALRYDRAPDEIAGMVVFSTLLSFLALPSLLALVF